MHGIPSTAIILSLTACRLNAVSSSPCFSEPLSYIPQKFAKVIVAYFCKGRVVLVYESNYLTDTTCLYAYQPVTARVYFPSLPFLMVCKLGLVNTVKTSDVTFCISPISISRSRLKKTQPFGNCLHACVM